jgi:hypothetical protein
MEEGGEEEDTATVAGGIGTRRRCRDGSETTSRGVSAERGTAMMEVTVVRTGGVVVSSRRASLVTDSADSQNRSDDSTRYPSSPPPTRRPPHGSHGSSLRPAHDYYGPSRSSRSTHDGPIESNAPFPSEATHTDRLPPTRATAPRATATVTRATIRAEPTDASVNPLDLQTAGGEVRCLPLATVDNA